MRNTNIRVRLELRIARHKGELQSIEKEIGNIEAGNACLPDLREKAEKIEGVIASLANVIKFDHPNWQEDSVKPVKLGRWTSPFTNGELGRTALAVLRANGGWMSCSEIATRMLQQIGHDPRDVMTSERVSNTVGNYVRKYKDDLVEIKHEYPNKWRVIRKTR